ncbi:MAG: biliverdin-producing heme oxygenase [Acidimicrobiia bacterium]|nr:biliverdin-producing heme oxygenase [Acidimicrobiia bacterium]
MRITSATGLAARLRDATSTQHRETEARSFVVDLMQGALDLQAYTRYLAQYAYVYRTLESRNARPDDPEFVNDPALLRFPSIVSDLSNLGAADWETSHPPLPATRDYTQRIESVSSNLPRYVAHHYTRYLGDLSGGQAIAKRVAEHYGATDNQLSFYRFDAIDRPGRFRVEYRHGLDSLNLGDRDEADLIAEAQLAFRLNADLFDALGAS